LPAGASAEAGGGEALVFPLLNQFNQMQQQMFEQFHQSMMLMVQMFGTLHRDQMGMIRDELDRVRQISQELLALQADLARHSAAKGGARPAPVPPRPSLPAPTADNGSGAAQPQPAPGNPFAEAGRGRSETPAGQRTPSPGTAGQSPEELHAWLNQRIQAIQQERQSRWQKILNFLRGKRPEEPPQ
jgi:hypothetical protein